MKGMIYLYSNRGEVVKRYKYYTKESRREVINSWICRFLGENTGYYYQIVPELEVKKKTSYKDLEPERKPIKRPPAKYNNLKSYEYGND